MGRKGNRNKKSQTKASAKRAHSAAPPARPQRRNAIITALVVIAVVGAVIFAAVRGSRPPPVVAASPQPEPTLDPAWSERVKDGALAFAANCQMCHGRDASGTSNGPPLVHRIYEPSHHADGAFWKAVRSGVRPHHWKFGPMPRIEVEDTDVRNIILYVRTLQRRAGIY